MSEGIGVAQYAYLRHFIRLIKAQVFLRSFFGIFSVTQYSVIYVYFFFFM